MAFSTGFVMLDDETGLVWAEAVKLNDETRAQFENKIREIYDDLIKSEPARYDYRLDLAQVYYLTNNFDAAIEQINIISVNAPEMLKGKETLVNLIKAGNKK